MKAILRDPPDRDALERLYTLSPEHNSTVRTTCVATTLEAGHAANALPQRARANVNCRILPGVPVDSVRATLVRVLADDKISVTPVGEADLSPAPPLTPMIMEPVKAVTNEMWPGVPVIPTMLVATSDGRYLNNAGIWAYGVSGMFVGVEGNGIHGLDEHIRVKSLYDGLEFLYRLGRRLGQQ
jgi:acetylornithine deacetylase/succinyl-diaminopimelate desuccinylase-like protein